MKEYKRFFEEDSFPLYIEFIKNWTYNEPQTGSAVWRIKKGTFLKRTNGSKTIARYLPTQDFGTYVKPKKQRFLDVQLTKHSLSQLIDSGVIKLQGARFNGR